MRFWVKDLKLRIQGSGHRTQGSGFRTQDSGLRVQGSGFIAYLGIVPPTLTLLGVLIFLFVTLISTSV
jgi:hypothetical protein